MKLHDIGFIVSHDKIRNLCIERNYFTRGTVVEYEKLFEMVPNDYWYMSNNLNDLLNLLTSLAEMIYHHSNTINSIEDIAHDLYHNAVITYLA